MRLMTLCCAMAWTGAQGMWAQTDVVVQWMDEKGNPACQSPSAGHTLHVSAWIDGVTQTAIQAEDLVVDSTGTCFWPGVASGVYTLEALPWSWTMVIEPQAEVDTVTLIWPSRPFQGLRKNPSKVRYAEGHPGAAVDSLQSWLSRQLDSLDLDQLMASGAVGANATQSAAAREALKQALERGNQEIAARLTLAPHTLWGDLMASLVREWQMSLGATEDLAALLAWEGSGEARSWKNRLASPGWCSSWELQHDQWWDVLEEARRPWRSWVAMGDVDSLCQATGWSLDELHLAMWMGQGQTWSRWAESWWDLRWKDQCDVAGIRRESDQARRYVLTGQAWGDVMWMMPNRDLEPAWAGEGDWRVWLITRSGSAAGTREWSILRSWMANQAPRDVSWGVLSVDANEEGWSSTLAQREQIRERIRWVGRDPSWWDRLDVSRVPQVVVVRPDGEIHTHHASLPSEGLFAELKRWRLTVR